MKIPSQNLPRSECRLAIGVRNDKEVGGRWKGEERGDGIGTPAGHASLILSFPSCEFH